MARLHRSKHKKKWKRQRTPNKIKPAQNSIEFGPAFQYIEDRELMVSECPGFLAPTISDREPLYDASDVAGLRACAWLLPKHVVFLDE